MPWLYDDDADDDGDRVCGVLRPAWKFGGHEWRGTDRTHRACAHAHHIIHMPAIWTAIKNNPPGAWRAVEGGILVPELSIWAAGKLQTQIISNPRPYNAATLQLILPQEC